MNSEPDSISIDHSASTASGVRFPFLLWILAATGLLAINFATQPYEDAISLVPPTIPYYLDLVWYLDDIIGPSLFMTAGLILLRRVRFNLSMWPLMGLGLSCIAFSLGDTMDAHWVFSRRMEVSHESGDFSSWMSKVMVVIVFYFFIIHAYDLFSRRAQKAMIFAALLLYIDQIQMSISLDFAGYSFHVFEETLEVVTSLFFCLGVACGGLKDVQRSDGD